MRFFWLPLLVGCKQLPNIKDLKDLLPEVHFSDMKIEKIDFDGLDAKAVLDVTNPYPVGLSLADTSWKLGLAGNPFLDGTDSEGLQIGPAESSKLRIPFGLKFIDAFKVVTDAKGKDQLPYDFEANLGFDTPVGRVDVPVKKQGELPALHIPKLSLKALRVDGLDLKSQTAKLALDLQMQTDQGAALTFEGFDYDVSFAGSRVADGTALFQSVAGQSDVTLPINLKLLDLGAAIVSAVTKKTPLEVRFTGDASIGTPFGPVPLSFDEKADLTPK